MANILIFNQVTKKLIEYKKSVNTPDYSWRSDVLVNPNIPNVPFKYLEVRNRVVVELSQVEKDAVDQAETDAQAQAEINRIDNLDISLKELIGVLEKKGIISKTEIITELKK